MSDERRSMIRFEVTLHCLQCDEMWTVELHSPSNYGPGSYGIEQQMANHICPT